MDAVQPKVLELGGYPIGTVDCDNTLVIVAEIRPGVMVKVELQKGRVTEMGSNEAKIWRESPQLTQKQRINRRYAEARAA